MLKAGASQRCDFNQIDQASTSYIRWESRQNHHLDCTPLSRQHLDPRLNCTFVWSWWKHVAFMRITCLWQIMYFCRLVAPRRCYLYTL